MENILIGWYKYYYEKQLGSGSFGSVYLGEDLQSKNKDKVAVKIILKEKLNQYGDYSELALQREIETQKIASDSDIPFFVKLYDHFEDQLNIYLILEYCDQSLTQILRKFSFEEKECLEIILQIGIGLNYLHTNQITHRDIKPENILLNNKVVRIADFGFASNSSMLTTNLGTAPFMAPELFSDETQEYD